MCKCDDVMWASSKYETLSFLYAVAWLCTGCVMGYDDDEAKSRYFVYCVYSHDSTELRENAFKTDFFTWSECWLCCMTCACEYTKLGMGDEEWINIYNIFYFNTMYIQKA